MHSLMVDYEGHGSFSEADEWNEEYQFESIYQPICSADSEASEYFVPCMPFVLDIAVAPLDIRQATQAS